MFRHRPSRLPDTITTPQRSSRPRPRPGRRRCGLGVARLEDRTLLSADDGFGHDLLCDGHHLDRVRIRP